MMPRDPEPDTFENTDPELRIVQVRDDDYCLSMPGESPPVDKQHEDANVKFFSRDLPKAEVRMRKIALLGTAPTWQAAPFDDPTWEIWGIFGVALVSKRLTRLFELHDKSIIEPMVKQFSPDGRYWDVCKKMGADFCTKDAYEQAPEATRFNFDKKIEKYGKYFASSASWMLAEAIDQNPAEIAIYGINMAADEEYAHQKPSLSYLIGWAKAQGIKITIPSSSELMALTHMYGVEAPPRFLSSLAQRKHEVNQALAVAKSQLLTSQLQIANAEGAANQLQWIEQNFRGE